MTYFSMPVVSLLVVLGGVGDRTISKGRKALQALVAVAAVPPTHSVSYWKGNIG